MRPSRRGTEYLGVPDSVGPGFEVLPKPTDGWWPGAYVYSYGEPPGNVWLKCDGSLKRCQDYPMLAALFGKSFGGDGIATFGLPAAPGKFLMAKTDTGTGSSVGETGGALDHTHAVAMGLPDATLFSVLSVPAPPVPPDNLAAAGHRHPLTETGANPPYVVVGDLWVHI